MVKSQGVFLKVSPQASNITSIQDLLEMLTLGHILTS
jgi:hypothetical protein